MAKKTANTGLTKWDADLAEIAKLGAKTVEGIGSAGNMIKCAGGVVKYKDSIIAGAKMRIVVLDHVLFNGDYEGRYDPNNPSQPRCFAIAREKGDMAPSDKSSDKQNPTCIGCWANEFKSAGEGRKGKHCGNHVRLEVIAEGDLEEPGSIATTDVAYIHIFPTSMAAWAAYVKTLDPKPTCAFVTEFAVVPDPKNQFAMTFSKVGMIEDSEALGAVIARYKKNLAARTIFWEYEPIEEEKTAVKKASPAKKRKF